MYKVALAVLATVLSVSLFSTAQARDDEWTLLFAEERARVDVIDVRPNMGRFKSVRVLAVNDSIYVTSVTLKLSGGKTRKIKVEKAIPKGGASAPIELPGGREAIYAAEVEYKVRLPSGGYAALQGLIADEPGGYQVLETKLLDTKDREVKLRVDRSEKPVTSIRLRAWVDTVLVRSAEIVFADGGRQKIRIRERLEPGEATDPIDLDGYRRKIKSVVLTLKPQQRRVARTRIDLLGKVVSRKHLERRRGNRFDGGGQRGRLTRLDRGWELLGTQKASLLGDADVFRIGKRKGRFTSIRVRARDQDIKMYGMTITYGNGNRESIAIYGTLQAGHISEAFDLKGRERYIDRIEFKYRTKLNSKGQGKVELWGKGAR